MKNGLTRALLLTALLGGASAAALRAQAATGLPVRNAGIVGGLTLGGEVGFPNADYGKGTAFGARAALGLGPFGLSAVASRWNPDGPVAGRTGVGGYLNLKIFGGPLIPLSVTLQGGVEYANDDGIKQLHAPVGLGIALRIPNPALAIKPWIAPRLDVARFTGDNIESDTKTNFGISGGVDLSLLGGLTFTAAYDRTWVNDFNPSVFSLGASYSIKIPGM
jgi:opacity protein-like surface antigen